jgi:hypothetical protein|tara:strand:- start:655 stop:846 length:192 start_codon:yes stop_codon:yes gene_type:complete
VGFFILFMGMFATDNAEFFKTVTEQQLDGHKWEYTGKQKPDGNPAITVKPQHGDEYILYKLKM